MRSGRRWRAAVAKLRVTQVRSVIGTTRRQRDTIRALGLKRIRHTVVQDDRPEIRGMIAKVRHMVHVEEED
jgi:large subunit ribosomal protein L30